MPPLQRGATRPAPSGPGRPAGLPWTVLARWGAVATVVLGVAWLSLARGGWVPFLSGVDLGVHEFGHMIFLWAPSLWMSFAGSLVQVSAPAGLAAYFGWRGDRVGVVLMLGWLGMSLNNVSVYLGDAQRMILPLFGDDGSGAGHDWHNILGALGLLEWTDALSAMVRIWALMAFLAALGLAAWFARGDVHRAASPRPAQLGAWSASELGEAMDPGQAPSARVRFRTARGSSSWLPKSDRTWPIR